MRKRQAPEPLAILYLEKTDGFASNGLDQSRPPQTSQKTTRPDRDTTWVGVLSLVSTKKSFETLGAFAEFS